MRVLGISLGGKLTLVHLALVLTALQVQTLFWPIDRGEVSAQQLLISDTATLVLSVLMFPLSLLESWLRTQPVFLVYYYLTPMNSCLWGFTLAWLWQRLSAELGGWIKYELGQTNSEPEVGDDST